MKERKYEKVETTELLNFVAKDIDWRKDKERDKQTDFKNELENREPFRDMKQKIDRMSNQIQELNNAVTKLINHKHDQQGNVVITVDKAIKTFW